MALLNDQHIDAVHSTNRLMIARILSTKHNMIYSIA